jgi:diguanylate cyclase (GGDEF)-like protein/PAS domain S-box-containing protein
MDENQARIAALEADIAHLQQALGHFYEQQQLFENLLRYAPVLIFIRDREGRFVAASQAYADMLGVAPADMYGRTPYDLLPEHTARRFLQQDADVLAGETCVEREFTETIDGVTRVLLATKFPLYDVNGRLYAIGGISTDLSDYRQAEIALREQQALLQAFLDHAPAVISFKDREGRYVMVNRRYREILRNGAGTEVIGRTLEAFAPTQTAAAISSQDQVVLQTSQPVFYESELEISEERHTFITVKFPVLDAHQALRGIGSMSIDITEHKQAETNLYLFKTLVDSATDGIVLLRSDGTIYHANETALHLLGVTMDEMVGMFGKQFDLSGQLEHIDQALRAGGSWQGELQVQRIDGSFWYAQASAFALREAEELRYVAVTFRDITERRWLEEQLGLTRFALDNASDGVAFLNQEGYHIYTNQAFCRLHGYESHELLNMCVSDIDPQLDPDKWQVIWEMVRREKSGCFEGRHYRKDGSSFPVEISATFLEFQGHTYICAFTRDITERKAYQRQIEQLAFSDPLTGLANRRWLYEAGARALAEAEAGTVALIYLDLDRFKAFNDNLGHDIGDALLVQVTARLRTGVNDHGVMARIGGDEFAVLLSNTSTSAALAVGKRLLELLHQSFEIQGHCVHLSGSIGIAIGPLLDQPFSTLITHADIAMYRAKRNNRGIEVYDPTGDAPSAEQIQLEAELRQALQNEGLVLHYQPVLDVNAQTLFAFEALVRWPHPQRGLLPPAAFLPLADEIGLSHELDDWVLRTAIRQVAAWSDRGVRCAVTVNLGETALQQVHFLEYVMELLEANQVPPGCLIIEVTEHTALRDITLTTEVLSSLRQIGVRIALDDFGTGYASLTHLRELPVDILKIERIFTSGIGQNFKDEAVLRAMLALGEGLELKIVAEGVETEAQLDWLRAAGCRHIQGFLLGRPAPAETVMGDSSSPTSG